MKSGVSPVGSAQTRTDTGVSPSRSQPCGPANPRRSYVEFFKENMPAGVLSKYVQQEPPRLYPYVAASVSEPSTGSPSQFALRAMAYFGWSAVCHPALQGVRVVGSDGMRMLAVRQLPWKGLFEGMIRPPMMFSASVRGLMMAPFRQVSAVRSYGADGLAGGSNLVLYDWLTNRENSFSNLPPLLKGLLVQAVGCFPETRAARAGLTGPLGWRHLLPTLVLGAGREALVLGDVEENRFSPEDQTTAEKMLWQIKRWGIHGMCTILNIGIAAAARGVPPATLIGAVRTNPIGVGVLFAWVSALRSVVIWGWSSVINKIDSMIESEK